MVNSNFSPQDKKPGDLILSADWNAAMSEIKRLEKAKVNREGADTLKGPLTIQEALNVTGDVKISGNVQLDANREIFLADNGQIRSLDNAHRILFRRAEDKLELREYGDIIFSPGATNGKETAKVVLQSNGSFGIGSNPAQDKLDVAGNLRILSNTNPIRFTSSWSNFPDAVTNQAEICNDTQSYKTLMIVGNKSAGEGRRVSVWDKLEVNGDLNVNGKLEVSDNIKATGSITGNRLSITDKVGIGTTSPNFHLEVGNKDTVGTWKLGVSGRGATGNFRQWTLRTGDGTNSTEIHKLRIRDEQAQSDRITMDENGNVMLIGTVTAQAFIGIGAFVTGMILMWSGLDNNIPTGWALCNGNNGTPDLRGRFVLASGQGIGLTNRTVNQKGGVERHQLSLNEMPSHNHQLNDPGHLHTWTATTKDQNRRQSPKAQELSKGNSPYGFPGDTMSKDTDSKKTGITIQNTGGNQTHENMPPFYVLAYIMKT